MALLRDNSFIENSGLFPVRVKDAKDAKKREGRKGLKLFVIFALLGVFCILESIFFSFQKLVFEAYICSPKREMAP